MTNTFLLPDHQTTRYCQENEEKCAVDGTDDEEREKDGERDEPVFATATGLIVASCPKPA